MARAECHRRHPSRSPRSPQISVALPGVAFDIPRSSKDRPNPLVEIAAARRLLFVVSMRWIVAVVTLVGCGQPRHSLAELVDASVSATMLHVPAADPYEANAFPGPLLSHVLVAVTSKDCASFADDLHASFAGVDLAISDAVDVTGEDNLGRGNCVGASASATIDDEALFAGEPAEITLSDSSGTWTIRIPGLDDVVELDRLVPGTTTTLTWHGGLEIRALDLFMKGPNGYSFGVGFFGTTYARFDDTVAEIDLPADLAGPVEVHAEIDSKLSEVGATPDAHGASCIGPNHCSVDATVFFYAASLPVAAP